MRFSLLYALAQPHRRRLVGASALMLAESGVSLSVPWVAGFLAQQVLSRDSSAAWPLLLALVGLLAAQAVLRYWNVLVTGRCFAHLLADLRVRVYDHLQSLPLAFVQQRRKGELMALLTHQVSQLAGFIGGTLIALVPQLLLVAGAVGLMFRIEPLLAALVAVLVPVFFLAMKFYGRGLKPLSLRLQEEDARAVAVADENLGMLPAIKTFTREAHASSRHAQQANLVRDLGIQHVRSYAVIEPLVQLAAGASAVILLWVMGERIGSGRMDAAQLVSFVLYAALLTRPVSALAGSYGQTLMARATLERLSIILDETPEGHAGGTPLPVVRGQIQFDDVFFSYPGRTAALSGLTLRIEAGETLGITGENGAGKSTLAHLLMRLYLPQQGQIRIDGIDIAGVTLESLRRQVGIVPQHVLLFNGSIQDNIAYGRVGAERSDIERAARLAQAHDFISKLPQGYDTIVGDEGIRLSGGQRQRLALARALLKDPPILVLDEATAMFDPEGEADFIHSFKQTLGRRTVILITHRPASLALADRVVVMHKGSVQRVSRHRVVEPA